MSQPQVAQPRVGQTQGRDPVAGPAAAVVGMLLALVLIGAGVVGIREALLGAGAISGPHWAANAAAAIDGLAPETWMVPAGVGAMFVGIWWVLAALMPRRHTELALQSADGVWMRPAGLARMARATADCIAGTTTARAKTRRRRVVVTITATDKEAQELRVQVAEAVAARLASVTRRYSVTVKVKTTHHGDAA